MADILNLDDLPTTVERTIQWKGNVYNVQPMTVKGFINSVKAAKKMEKDPDRDLGDEVGLLVQTVIDSVPNFPQEDLWSLPLDKLNMVVGFLQKQSGELVNEVEEGNVVRVETLSPPTSGS